MQKRRQVQYRVKVTGLAKVGIFLGGTPSGMHNDLFVLENVVRLNVSQTVIFQFYISWHRSGLVICGLRLMKAAISRYVSVII